MELFTEQEFLEKYSNSIESIDEVTIIEASEMIFAQVSPCFRDYNWTDGKVPQAIKNAAMEQARFLIMYEIPHIDTHKLEKQEQWIQNLLQNILH